MRHRSLLVLLLAGASGLLVVACGSDDPPPPTPTATQAAVQGPTPTPTPARSAFEIEWDALVEAAQAEGEVQTFLCCAIGEPASFQAMQPIFEDRFNIKWVNSTGSSSTQFGRTMAEREAGRYTLDIWGGGTNTSINRLLPGEVLDPIEIGGLLIHPEITDLSNWYQEKLHYAEGHVQLLSYSNGDTFPKIEFNTDLLDPTEIQSWKDLLDPKYKGKIVIGGDPRDPGVGGADKFFFYSHPDLGIDYITALLFDQEITFMPNEASAADRLARGVYSICLFGCDTGALESLGLPVSENFPHRLSEGSYANASFGTIYAMNTPPNPNAQKLWMNWWLGREGQAAMQNATGRQSLRADIPLDGVAPRNVRVGDETILESVEGYQATVSEIIEVLNEIMGPR